MWRNCSSIPTCFQSRAFEVSAVQVESLVIDGCEKIWQIVAPFLSHLGNFIHFPHRLEPQSRTIFLVILCWHSNIKKQQSHLAKLLG
ncbi:unnamed protein product [Haemonchus placei]|uniref:Ovule protein n=1 Tax=Haemonchus placei TaxID=6290 RepID=A0A158QLC7_HAEPC|nr:unnamed protein product [Haemonchus placei]